MCTSMAIWGKMEGIAFGTPQPDAIAFGMALGHALFSFRQIHLRCAEVVARGEPTLTVVEGLLKAEASRLLEDFRRSIAEKKDGDPHA